MNVSPAPTGLIKEVNILAATTKSGKSSRDKKRKDPKGRRLKPHERYIKDKKLYSYRWTDSDGKRREVYAKTLNDLRAKENKIERDKLDGIVPDDPTMNMVFDKWYKKAEDSISDNTLGNYTDMYDRHVRPSLGKKRIKSVTKNHVTTFYKNLHIEHGLAFSTLETINNVLSQIFKTALDDDIIRKNPASGALAELKKMNHYVREKRHAMTIPQQRAFIDTIRDHPWAEHWLPLFVFFLGIGCRVEEVIGLRWADVDMEEGLITLDHRLLCYDRKLRKARYYILPGLKNGDKMRQIPILNEVRQALLDERTFQKNNGMTCKVNYDGYTDFIFLNRFGNVHNPRTINNTIDRIIDTYNREEIEAAKKEDRVPLLIPHFSIHSFRHTFATRYCEVDDNVKVLQEILGHKDIRTTMDIYVEVTNASKKKTFDGLDGKITVI